MTITLRPYQQDGMNAIWDYFQQGGKGNPVLAWPTGTGKSVVPAIFIKSVMELWPTQRFLLLTHVKELIAQNAEVLRLVWPNVPLGIYSAGLKEKNWAMPVVFAGIQSAIKNPSLFGHRDIIFIDEGHLISTDEASMYLTFIATMKLINPNVKIIGLTATPFRMGQGMITDGGLFTDIVHDLTGMDNFNKLILDGYLAPLVPQRTKIELDISNVGMAKGEYIQSQLQHAVDVAEITFKGLTELVAAAKDRKSWLIFSSGIEHAEHISQMLYQFGIDGCAVHSKNSSEFNDKAIAAFKNGDIRYIVNYGKLTTGFNHPNIDCIGMFRPTMSVSLWVQMLGRGTRPAEGKLNCIAEGSLVLTDTGLIPIEKITLNDKVWDGEEFVSHDGVVYQGYKKVIEHDGLYCTPEHKLWTKEGWKAARECIEKRYGIAITGNGGSNVQLSKNYFTRNNLPQTNLYSCSMYSLFSSLSKRIYKCSYIKSWLPQMWQLKWQFTKMAYKTLLCCKSALCQSEKQSLLKLWWPGYKIQFQFAIRNGTMGTKQFRNTSKFKYRSQRQQWELRGWKFKIFNALRKYVEPKIIKKHVFDITNTGKLHRFTVNGLLVSNCLVLDFAKNTPRLGPINDPVIPRKKGEAIGDVPVKLCNECGVYNHIKAKTCTSCGAEFSFEIKITAKSGSHELIKSDLPIIEYYDVERVIYQKKQKEGKPAYIRATYYCGIRSFNENIFPEYPNSLTRHKFHQWWKQRHQSNPPSTSDDVLNLMSELRKPKQIRVWVNKPYPEILSAEY